MADEKKPSIATHAHGAGGTRILPVDERTAVDAYVEGIMSKEWDELGVLIKRVCEADGIDQRDGVLFIADVRGGIGAWLLKVLTQDKVSATEYSNQASRDRRFAPVVAQFWGEQVAAQQLPRIVPGALEAVGPRRDDAIRVVIVNKTNQIAIAHRAIDGDTHA